MSSYEKKIKFFATQAGDEFKETLALIAADSGYNTKSSYTSDSSVYPDNLIPFVDKHVKYMQAHPSTNPEQYLSNLRLITRVR